MSCEHSVIGMQCVVSHQLKEKIAGLEKKLTEAESEKMTLKHQLTEKQGQVRGHRGHCGQLEGHGSLVYGHGALLKSWGSMRSHGVC